MSKMWLDKRFHSLDFHLKEVYGQKLYKISLAVANSCPNRDGTLSTKGCLFCSEKGSGDFADTVLKKGKAQSERKYTGDKYIAYSQAFTGTYGDLNYLKQRYEEIIAHPDVQILAIATRPDCLDEQVLDMLSSLNEKKPIWVELGLQTIHEQTANFLNRGFSLATFSKALEDLRKRNIPVITHVIFGLPGETREMMMETIKYLNQMDIQGIKIHLLYITEGTPLADYYKKHPFPLPEITEYFSLLGEALCNLREDIVIHRLTGDGPKDTLIAPLWTKDKRQVLNKMNAYFKAHNIWQGKEISYDRHPEFI